MCDETISILNTLLRFLSEIQKGNRLFSIITGQTLYFSILKAWREIVFTRDGQKRPYVVT